MLPSFSEPATIPCNLPSVVVLLCHLSHFLDNYYYDYNNHHGHQKQLLNTQANLLLLCPTEDLFEQLMRGLEAKHGPRNIALEIGLDYDVR